MDKQRESLTQRINGSEPVDQGWTNRVYRTKEGTVIKVFSNHMFEALIFGIADILHGKLNMPFKGERLQKEIEMKKSLKEKEYFVPEIIKVYSNALEMEEIEGYSLAELFKEEGPEQLDETGQKIGRLIARLHKQKFSLGDATFENFYINGDQVYTIDHEYGSLNSDFFDRERDVIHILSDALEQEHGKYEAFREGFEKAFREFNSTELISAISFSIFTSVLGLQPRRLKRTLLNAVKN